MTIKRNAQARAVWLEAQTLSRDPRLAAPVACWTSGHAPVGVHRLTLVVNARSSTGLTLSRSIVVSKQGRVRELATIPHRTLK